MSKACFWLTFVSVMDVFLTGMILARGGRELNPLAREVIHWGGLPGMLAFKFSLLFLLVVLCERFAGRRPRAGRFMAAFAVTVWGLPPAFALLQLAA